MIIQLQKKQRHGPSQHCAGYKQLMGCTLNGSVSENKKHALGLLHRCYCSIFLLAHLPILYPAGEHMRAHFDLTPNLSSRLTPVRDASGHCFYLDNAAGDPTAPSTSHVVEAASDRPSFFSVAVLFCTTNIDIIYSSCRDQCGMGINEVMF